VSDRTYPAQPIVGVGAVVIAQDRIVLVKRAHDPLKGQWNLPGGAVELGETLQEACSREVLEETGLEVRVGSVIEVFDRIIRDANGHVEYHFVLVDYLCRVVGGTLQSGSDASDIALADPFDLDVFGLNEKARHVIERGMALLSEEV
jgi:ADP-ribose pyrophosphatase YjhB (NUDIX family)